MFIDFLALEKKDFSKNNLIVFYWKSGSWKSSYLDFFIKQKNYEKNIFLFHKKEKLSYKKVSEEFVFIDEIVYFRQFFIVLKYLFDWKKIFIATHIHPFFYKIIFFFYKNNYYFTDKNNKKIEKFLEEKWYNFSKETVKNFLKKHKWNFLDLQIILKFYKKSKDFDEIFYLFEKECCMKYNNNLKKIWTK